MLKKIVNEKLYNPSTAKRIFGWDNQCYGDFRFEEEILFRKRTNPAQFFLYCSGGPMTQYARSEGNTTYGSETIKPLSLEQAKIWLEKKADADTYIQIFGPVEE